MEQQLRLAQERDARRLDQLMSISSTVDTSVPPRLYLLLENPRKCNNLGPILRCAAAFGVSQVVAVGFDTCSTHGSHGAAKHVSMVAFPTVDQAVSYLRDECDCKSMVGILGGVADAYDTSGYSVLEENENHVVSVEEATDETAVTKRSYPIHCRPFLKGNCCFVISKNPKGLPNSLASQCNFFVHVPHINVTDDEPSRLLDAPSCLSIALHHFTTWAQYDERDFQEHKYEVGMAQQRTSDEKEATRLARAEARQRFEEACEDAIGADAIGGMFGEDAGGGDY